MTTEDFNPRDYYQKLGGNKNKLGNLEFIALPDRDSDAWKTLEDKLENIVPEDTESRFKIVSSFLVKRGFPRAGLEKLREDLDGIPNYLDFLQDIASHSSGTLCVARTLAAGSLWVPPELRDVETIGASYRDYLQSGSGNCQKIILAGENYGANEPHAWVVLVDSKGRKIQIDSSYVETATDDENPQSMHVVAWEAAFALQLLNGALNGAHNTEEPEYEFDVDHIRTRAWLREQTCVQDWFAKEGIAFPADHEVFTKEMIGFLNEQAFHALFDDGHVACQHWPYNPRNSFGNDDGTIMNHFYWAAAQQGETLIRWDLEVPPWSESRTSLDPNFQFAGDVAIVLRKTEAQVAVEAIDRTIEAIYPERAANYYGWQRRGIKSESGENCVTHAFHHDIDRVFDSFGDGVLLSEEALSWKNANVIPFLLHRVADAIDRFVSPDGQGGVLGGGRHGDGMTVIDLRRSKQMYYKDENGEKHRLSPEDYRAMEVKPEEVFQEPVAPSISRLLALTEAQKTAVPQRDVAERAA